MPLNPGAEMVRGPVRPPEGAVKTPEKEPKELLLKDILESSWPFVSRKRSVSSRSGITEEPWLS